MARIRTVKPDTFKHEDLFDAEQESGLPLRLAYVGLWTQCDREGRFAWRPRQLKTDVLPYDDVDFSRVLDALWTRGFIVKYACDGNTYGCIPSWHRHQVINNREKDSDLPAPDDETIVPYEQSDACATRAPRDTEMHKGKGKEGEGERKGKDVSYDTSNARAINREFDETFWPEYPHKVGKPDALKAFVTARKAAELNEIMAGLRRYVTTKPSDRNWCNPGTFLRQQRWLDEPAPAPNGTGPPRSSYRDEVADAVEKIERGMDERNGNRDSDITTPSGARFSYSEA